MGKKKECRIPISVFEKVAKEQFVGTATVAWFGIDVAVKRTLPLPEMLMLVNEVVEASFLTDGTFVPEVMDFAIKSGVLTHYANFTLPDNLERQYELIYNTDAFDMVVQHINTIQLREIVDSANKKIEHICDSDIFALRARLEKLVRSFGNMETQMAGMFEGVDPQDIHSLLQALGNIDAISEEKIVNAYIEKTKTGFDKPNGGEEDVSKL